MTEICSENIIVFECNYKQCNISESQDKHYQMQSHNCCTDIDKLYTSSTLLLYLNIKFSELKS